VRPRQLRQVKVRGEGAQPAHSRKTVFEGSPVTLIAIFTLFLRVLVLLPMPAGFEIPEVSIMALILEIFNDIYVSNVLGQWGAYLIRFGVSVI
jgi:hypothetical protein